MQIDEHINAKFDVNEAIKRVSYLTASWWRNTSQAGLAISDSDLANVQQARDEAIRIIKTSFDQINEIAISRRENLHRFSDLRFLSLGEDCFSRTVLTRWGMKPSAAFGEKSTPFDLSVHPVPRLIEVLKNDFDGYLDDENLTFSERADYCRNTRYKLEFNHEKGIGYAEDGFSRLKAAISPRVERFRHLMSDGKPTCFTLHVRNPGAANMGNVQRLWEVIDDKFSGSKNFMVCVNTWKYGEPVNEDALSSITSDKIHVININYPFDNYVWFNHGHTERGHAFEREFIQEFTRVISHSSPN